MELVREFKDLNKDNVDIAGSKGASLGEMTRAKIPVPNGFVILSNAFEQFIKETKLDIEIDSALHSVNHEEIHTVENASEKIKALILNEDIPKDVEKEINKYFKNLDCKFVAVRSSATSEDSSSAAWAGQLESYLNTTSKTLLENVKRCWASLFTPRAIFYRFEKKLHKEKISVAVVVQKMIESEKSGIAFSVHPVTQDRNQLIIEAGYGLGEAIVSGTITPDSYVVEKNNLNLLEKNLNEQRKMLVKGKNNGNEWKEINKTDKEQILNDKQIIELAKLIINIEKHYKFPVDVEWAFEKNKFYIVQSRPITTLTENNIEKDIIKKNENKLENIPSFFKDLSRFATRPMTIQRDEFLGTMWWYLCKGRSVSIPLVGGNRMTYVEKNDAENGYKKIADEEFSSVDKWKKHLNEYYNLTKLIQEISNLAAKTDNINELSSIYKRWLENWNKFGKFIIAPYAVEKILDPECRKIIKQEFKENGDKIFAIISSPSKLNDFQKMRLDIIKSLLKNNKNYKQLAEKYGWYNEYSYVEPLLDEKYFEGEIKKLDKKSAIEEKNKILEDIEKNKKEFKEIIKKIKNKRLKLLADIFHNYAFIRTDRIDQLKQGQVKIRKIFERIALELNKITKKEWTKDMVAYCFNQEIIDFLSKKQIPDFDKVKARVGQNYIYYYENGSSNIIYNSNKINEAKNLIEKFEKKEEEIKGLIVFKGKIIGRVALVLDKSDLSKVRNGDILVAKTTMPDYTSAMNRAVAFVTEEGGVTSHAAIIARELKKPCIVGTGNCTKILKDGMIIEVDANHGIIKILQRRNKK